MRASAAKNHERIGAEMPLAMERWRGTSVVLLALSGVYLYAFPSATIPYFALVLLHAAIGLLLAILILPLLTRLFPAESWLARSGWLLAGE